MAEKNTILDALGEAWKAIVAGAGAGIAADWALVAPLGGAPGMLSDGKIDTTEAGVLVGTFFTAAVPVGFATWAKRNKPPKLASADVATAAAIQTVQNLTATAGGFPPITADDVAAVSTDAPDDTVAGKHAAQ